MDEIKAATERLQNVAHSLAQFMYQQPGAEGGAGPGAGGPQGEEQPEPKKKDDGDDVVDADYKEV